MMIRVIGHLAIAALLSIEWAATPAFGMQIEIAPIQAHEAAYEIASQIVVASIERFDEQGAWVRVYRTERGSIPAGTVVRLAGTSRFPFLAERGAGLVAFVKEIRGDCATLVYGPTSGGLLWKDDETLAMIASAHAEPATALQSSEVRTRLAAAYYLTVGAKASASELDDEQRTVAIDAALWGLRQVPPEVAQAAVTTLEAIGVDVGRYHPAARHELRLQLAEEITASLQ